MIRNYQELVHSIAKELDRDDLSDQIPEWIQMAELSLGRYIGLADGEQEATGATVIDEAKIAFPEGFKRLIHLELQGSPLRVLNVVSWDKRSDVLENDRTGRPRVISYRGRVGYVAPAPSAVESYMIIYYGRAPYLGPKNETNDLLEMGADVLKYEALKYSAPYLDEDQRLILWESILTPSRKLLKNEYWESKVGGGILVVRPDFAPNDTHDTGAFS